jgi:hypothetical protein
LWLGKTPVTQAAYQRVTGQKPSNFDGANLPVEMIAWKEADAYCRAIGGRLPTEAEWEYAARAGTTAEYYGNIDDIAWYRANSGKTTHEVGQKQPNAFGLYDMIGNVWQWTADWYGIYHPEDAIDPQGPATGEHRSLRGGAFDGDDRDLRVSMRTVLGAPENPDETIGFRCVAESPAPPPEAVVHRRRHPRPVRSASRPSRVMGRLTFRSPQEVFRWLLTGRPHVLRRREAGAYLFAADSEEKFVRKWAAEAKRSPTHSI